MKLRLVKRTDTLYLYCMNGSILYPNKEVLARLLTDFKRPQVFKGDNAYWNTMYSEMEDAPGETLAYVDDAKKLIILSDKVFADVVQKEEKYISATEYAERFGKCRATVKNLCVAGRLPGAYKTSSGWLIPENTPYPQDGRTTKAAKKE